MTTLSPAPLAELVQQWRTHPEFAEPGLASVASMTESRLQDIATQAARWGADQELEACCEFLRSKVWIESERVDELRAARRPKALGLKEQALIELCNLVDDLRRHGLGYSSDTIRRRP
jgi:hypothetical protein